MRPAAGRSRPSRTLSWCLVAAAVLGVSAGVVVGSGAGSGAGPSGEERSTPTEPTEPAERPSLSGPSDPGDFPSAADRAGQVLWADRVALHDGDLRVDIDLVDPPTSVQRADIGWVVTTNASAFDAEAQASVVRFDGEVVFLAVTVGFGDVSPDGDRYVAATGTSYEVWDLATGALVDTIEGGRRPDQAAFGGAQFVDDDTVATTWGSSDDRPTEVLRSDLGSGERRLLADDVLGDWGVSPDGRWFVGSLDATTASGELVEGCTLVRALDGSSDDLKDCAGTVDGVPAFTRDSSEVLTRPNANSFSGSAFRPLALEGGPGRAEISVPFGSSRAAYVDPETITVLRQTPRGAFTRVYVCAISRACAEVGRSNGPAADVVLGS